MSKQPAVTMEHLGALIDAVAATNAVLFTALASKGQSDAALELLDQVARLAESDDPATSLRGDVAMLTADGIRRLRGGAEASVRIGLEGMR